MVRIGKIVLCLLLALVVLTTPGTRTVRAEPAQFERACQNASLYILDMLLICDGAWAWCWDGWNYSGDEGGMAHYSCGPFD